jgi:hypothetical protein
MTPPPGVTMSVSCWVVEVVLVVVALMTPTVPPVAVPANASRNATASGAIEDNRRERTPGLAMRLPFATEYPLSPRIPHVPHTRPGTSS